MRLSRRASWDSHKPSWPQRPGQWLPAPESFAPSIASPRSWAQTSQPERFPKSGLIASVSRLTASPHIPQYTEINPVAGCPLTMIWFLGASSVLLVGFHKFRSHTLLDISIPSSEESTHGRRQKMKVTLHVDGGSRGNPGPAAAASSPAFFFSSQPMR